jgi:hypothetical protein
LITTTHAVINAALLGRKADPRRYAPVILGAIFPDIPGCLYMAFHLTGYFSTGTWDSSYYSPAWMPWVDWAHSIPLALAGVLVFLGVRYPFGLYFCLSMLLHDLEDILVHSERSHHHFIPFNDWRFISPLSCQEPAYHADWGASLEWALLLTASWFLWRRGLSAWAKGTLAFLVLAHGGWLAYFLLVGIHQSR